MKRREKDNAKRAQSRKWYFEKADWIVCDEIEDENADESIEEEEKEEEIVISTVAVVEGQNKVCPVCREEFSQFFKQVGIVILSKTSLVCNAMVFQGGDGNEEEGWYLHNAMEHENVIYHPECFKDKNNVVDTSMDTTTDSGLDTSAVVTKEEPADTEEEEAKPSTEEMQQEDSIQETNDVKEEPPSAAETSEEDLNVKEEITPIAAPTDAMEESKEDAEDVKTETDIKTEDVSEEPQEEEVKEDDPSANTSLVSDDNMMLAAPVVSQPKVVVANWRKGSHIGPSSVILYCMQKYILGHLPLSFRGQRMIGNLR